MMPRSLRSPVVVLGLTAMLLACERPPMETTQTGYRGLGMEQVTNPRIAGPKLDANVAPNPIPPVPAGGPRASETFKNVQVLGDLSANEFSRLMVAMTTWVSPQQGCTYCHEGDLSSDALYTKVVARRMIQMTRDINANWKPHVADTGVTCYTCHRGHPVPEAVWSTDLGPERAGGLTASHAGQNLPAATVGLTSLPYDPFTAFLIGGNEIRVQSATALPEGNPRDIKQTEATYGLMIHMSESLGVNCTYCHNSRSFMPWESSTPARVPAWHALRMVRQLNDEYIGSVANVLPANRKGPAGDPLKVNCATCHRGLPKPLQGVSLLQYHPELAGVPASAEPSVAP